MASDLSSGGTEINEAINDEKEEGEISLEDVSSSEEDQPYKYQSRAFEQCLYCLSTQHCATWCRSLTVIKNNHKRDAGLQGKENRSNQHYFNENSSCLGVDSRTTAITKNTGLYNTLQGKNNDDNDLIPISSDSDMELVGLGHDPKNEKKPHRYTTQCKPNIVRKKRRKKSPSLSLSLSPSSIDLTLSVKDSIHKIEPLPIAKKESIHKSHQHSSVKKKIQVPLSHRHKRPPAPRIQVLSQKRAKTPLPGKSSSPLRQRRLPQKKATSSVGKSSTPLQQSPSSCGNVTKLLKKVRKLEPFSSRSKEKGSSLKDKLSNIIKTKENSASATTKKEIQSKEKSVVEVSIKEKFDVRIEQKESKIENEEVTKNQEKEIFIQDKVNSHEEKNINEEDDDLIILRQLALETKHKKNILLRPDEIKSEPQEQPLVQQVTPPSPQSSPPPPSPPECSPPPPPPPECLPPPPPPPPECLPPPPPPPPECSPPLPPPESSPPPPPPESSPPPPPPPSSPSLRPIIPEPVTTDPKSQVVKLPIFCMDHNDEDLELRMIALRSAVLKKHRTRMQRGMKKQKNLDLSPLPRIESPFTSTFLEDFPLLAEICSPTSPLNQKDIYSTEDMELDSDMEQEQHAEEHNEQESPYSPSDDVSGVPVPIEVNSLIRKKNAITLSTNTNLYLKRMEIVNAGSKSCTENKLNNIMESVGQELRPYSPTDITIYDPELPGVQSNKVEIAPPLQPPPLPPLTMFQPPMKLACPTNLLNPFIDPSIQVLSTQPNNFTAIHQAVNPLLLSTTATASLFAYPTSPMINLPMTTQEPVEQHSHQSTIEINNTQLDDFGETDIDGSPLVEIEKDSQNHVSWSLINKPLYMQLPTNVANTNLNKIPSLLDIKCIPPTIMETSTLLPTKDLQKSKQQFKDLKTIKTMNSNFQPFKQSTSPKKLITQKSAAIFNYEENLGEELPETVRKGKRKLPTVLLERASKRKKSCTQRKCNNNVSSILTKSKEKYIEIKEDLMQQDSKRRRNSVDDDEEALREILLASLAKRSKGQQQSIVDKSHISDNLQNESSDNNPKVSEVKNLSLKPEFGKLTSETKVPIGTIQQKLVPATVISNEMKKSTMISLSPSEHPIRKFIKKTGLPASTKVVNNAKRYQNLLTQRKLNQQKISRIASSKNRFKVNNNKLNHMNIQNKGSPQLTKKIQDSERIIFYLQDDTDSESEAEEKSMKSKLNSTNRPELNIPTSDFERSVDQFLKNVRLQQEMTTKENVILPKTKNLSETKKSIPAVVTPKKTPLLASMVPPLAPVAKNVIPTIVSVTKDPLKKKISTSSTVPTNLAKEKNFASLSKGLKTDLKLPSLSATPQAVKHLPASQQEEYRRLKQQIFEREKIKLQKSKEAVTASISTTTQSTSGKIVNTPASVLYSSSLSSLSSSSIASITPKHTTKTVATSYSVKSRELPTLNKTVPKTHLIATISPMSKQNCTDVIKASATHSSSVIIKSVNSTQDNVSINKTVSTSILAKKYKTLPDTKAIAISSKVSLLSPKQAASDFNVNKQQSLLLNKMNDALNNQKMQITAVAQKVSSLRILTKEQINNKSKQIQQIMANSDGRIVMDDLNRDTHKLQSSLTPIDALKNANNQDSLALDTFKKDSKNNINTSTLQSNTDKQTSTKSVATKINKSTHNWDEFKQVVNDEVESLSTLSTDTQKNLLRETEEKLIKKRHLVLDDITEMSSNLRQWEMEKDIQNLLFVEMKSLQEQLRIAEKKLQKQKDKLNTIQPKVSNYHEKINNGRKECFRLSKICNGLGQIILGPNYKVPTAGAELLNNRIKEVASHTQKLRNKKSQSSNGIKNIKPTKTDKTILKNNSKSMNQNIKLKEANVKIISHNNELCNYMSESVDNNSIIDIIAEPIVNNNRKINFNKCVHDKVDSSKMQSNNGSSSINGKILNTKCKESITNSENNLNLVAILVANNLTPEIENQYSEVNVPDEIMNTENVNSETKNSLSNAAIVNTILVSENNINVDKSTSNCKSNVIFSVGNRVKTKSKKKLNDSKITNTDCILKDVTEQENDNELTEWSNQNSCLISQNNVSECTSVFARTSVDKDIFKSEKIELDNENCLINHSLNTSDLIQTNKNFNSEILLVDASNKNSYSMEENYRNEIEKQVFQTNINNKNFNSESSLFTNKNLPLKQSNTKILCIRENINVDCQSLTDHNSNNDSVSNENINATEKSVETREEVNLPLIKENIEHNYENNIFNESIEVLPMIIQTKKSDMKNKKSTTEIFNNEHSTLSEGIESLKLANVNEVSESIQYSESAISNTNMSHLVKSMESNNVLLSNQEDSRMKKKVFQPYESILNQLNIPRSNHPDGILCPFEIMGTCNDGDCQFIHQTTSHCQ